MIHSLDDLDAEVRKHHSDGKNKSPFTSAALAVIVPTSDNGTYVDCLYNMSGVISKKGVSSVGAFMVSHSMSDSSLDKIEQEIKEFFSQFDVTPAVLTLYDASLIPYARSRFKIQQIGSFARKGNIPFTSTIQLRLEHQL